jgi:hypothetical protein
MRRSLWLVLSAAALAAAAYAAGCGGDDVTAQPGDGGTTDGTAGDGGAVGEAGPPCTKGKFGAACTTGADCCSGLCDPTVHACGGSTHCSTGGSPCATATECCTLVCTNGSCGGTQCTSDNQPCTTDGQCCGGHCGGGTCTPLSTTCKTAGNACGANTECCSGLCDPNSKTCLLGSSFCTQNNDVCAHDNDCCGGICTVAPDAGAGALGTCTSPPNGGRSNCSGFPDGVLCTDCGQCCSALCAPYITGVNVCQPANGCHVEGDLCRADSDCCNSNPNGGNTSVTCIIAQGESVGYCSSPLGCRPLGDTCHYLNYTCGNSSKADDCCAVPNPSNKICKLDPLGVPRCAISTCVGSGTACSNSLDCCAPDGGVTPCIPGPNGTLVCGTANGCQQNGNTCTISADCCNGLACIVPPGGTQGTCGVVVPPTDAGVDSGGCSLYGQSCTQASDCCDPTVPCTINNVNCQPGQTGCRCVFQTH